MVRESTSDRAQGRASGAAPRSVKTVEDYARAFEQEMERELPVSLGFSARLNMLWDLAGAAPPQTEGRVISVLGINRDWRESDVRKWLQKESNLMLQLLRMVFIH